jgi:hypothetical protein
MFCASLSCLDKAMGILIVVSVIVWPFAFGFDAWYSCNTTVNEGLNELKSQCFQSANALRMWSSTVSAAASAYMLMHLSWDLRMWNHQEQMMVEREPLIPVKVQVRTTAALGATCDPSGNTLTATENGRMPKIDGRQMEVDDRVLVMDQGNDAHNGIYSVTDTGSDTTPWKMDWDNAVEDYSVGNVPTLIEEGSRHARCTIMRIVSQGPVWGKPHPSPVQQGRLDDDDDGKPVWGEAPLPRCFPEELCCCLKNSFRKSEPGFIRNTQEETLFNLFWYLLVCQLIFSCIFVINSGTAIKQGLKQLNDGNWCLFFAISIQFWDLSGAFFAVAVAWYFCVQQPATDMPSKSEGVADIVRLYKWWCFAPAALLSFIPLATDEYGPANTWCWIERGHGDGFSGTRLWTFNIPIIIVFVALLVASLNRAHKANDDAWCPAAGCCRPKPCFIFMMFLLVILAFLFGIIDRILESESSVEKDEGASRKAITLLHAAGGGVLGRSYPFPFTATGTSRRSTPKRPMHKETISFKMGPMTCE